MPMLTTTSVLLLAAFAQDVLPRAVLPKASIRIDPGIHDVQRVVLKLHEVRAGAPAHDALEAPGLRAAIGTRTVRPFFAGLERELAHLRARVLANTPPGRTPPADLSLYFEVDTRDLADAEALLARLNALDAVELAYPKERPMPPPGDIPPATPSFVSRQGYRDVAPTGIDARSIQRLTGAMGTGITVLDIEWGWWFDHEDLAVLRPDSLVGPPVWNNSYNNHGVAVVGEIAADADAFGVTGLTPDVRVLVATDYPQAGYSVARAIVAGLPSLGVRDVMLLEAQTGTPLGLGPTEWVQADFDAIQNATVAGVITVEAAGNGGVDLDDARLNRAFDLTFRDSGAIIVGASNGSTLVRAGFSTHGSRIDANGWGYQVASTGYGDVFNPSGDRRQQYTATFSGTSSASPIVTSAVVALLGAAKAQRAPAEALALDWLLIRSLLRNHGTPLPGQNISMRPDVGRALRAAGLLRDLTVLDAGLPGQTVRAEITPGFAATSSDAWGLLGAVLPANVALPGLCTGGGRLLLDAATMIAIEAGTFAAGSATVTMRLPDDPLIRGQRYHLQAVTWRAATGELCLGNGAVLLVEP